MGIISCNPKYRKESGNKLIEILYVKSIKLSDGYQ